MKEIQPEIVTYRVAQTVVNYILCMYLIRFGLTTDTFSEYVHKKDSPDVLHVLSYINMYTFSHLYLMEHLITYARFIWSYTASSSCE